MQVSKHPRRKRLIAVACGLMASVGATQVNARSDGDLAQQVSQAVSDCLGGKATASPPAQTLGAPPSLPGLGRDTTDLKIEHVPTSIGQLYAYHNDRGAEIVCGVALYEANSADAYRQVRDQLQASSKFKITDGSAYKFASPPTSASSYFGDSNAPGLAGVVVLQRSKGLNAPTLQVDYHSTLMH